MNRDSIRQLRQKFIFIAMVSIAIVMFCLAALINGVNYTSTRSEIHETLNFISENGGEISNAVNQNNPSNTQSQPKNGSSTDSSTSWSSIDSSPEFKYSTRYFAVTLDKNGKKVSVNLNHIAAIDESEALAYAKTAIKRFFKFGSFGDYYYEVTPQSDGSTLIVFLDSSVQIRAYLRLFYGSLFICLGGLIIVFLFIYFLSNRVIQPEIEAVEKQKQFITNASHELKTPLAVIRANTELEEMMTGRTEWTESTLNQVDRLNGLVQHLVTLTRASEQEDNAVITDVDVTKNIEGCADTFEPLAVKNGKQMVREIAQGIHMRADSDVLRQLAGLLLDNAIKYCDDGGKIVVSLSKKGKAITLAVSNSYADGKNTDFSRFFERFYRKDESHNVEKGGYGIGLSIAQNIVARYHGSIGASWKDGMITFGCVLYSL